MFSLFKLSLQFRIFLLELLDRVLRKGLVDKDIDTDMNGDSVQRRVDLVEAPLDIIDVCSGGLPLFNCHNFVRKTLQVGIDCINLWTEFIERMRQLSDASMGIRMRTLELLAFTNNSREIVDCRLALEFVRTLRCSCLRPALPRAQRQLWQSLSSAGAHTPSVGPGNSSLSLH